ncbi:MAG: PQQ-dependent sugar dehydrogenase [Nocardioidaceae bacterium]|nr:PQQ-dependent sugar dehydrogenase [Nocardioidaceae bacterium]
MRRLALALTAGAVLLAGCGGGDDSPAEPEPTVTAQPTTGTGTATPPVPQSGPPKVVGTIARDLEVPWGIAFLPDGSALVTERDRGRVLLVRAGQAPREVGTVDQTRADGEAGLLGLAVSPSYASDKAVFLYATTDEDNRVLRATYDGQRLGPLTPILTGIPKGHIHDGGRLAFGPDGYLYVSTGETGDGPLAQDRGSLGGKILRITRDGDPAPGNPDPRSPVWSFGHRNVQGLAFDNGARLWASEFGQDAWDELNLIQPGKNYGWPEVEGRGDDGRFVNPQQVWRTDEASPSGLAFTPGAGDRGRLWLASLRGERLWRIDVAGPRSRNPKAFFVGRYGRMRTVVVAPDGNLWVATSNRDGRGDPADGDDRILLVSPGG